MSKLLMPTTAPRLPNAKQTYNQQDWAEFARVLNLYFAQNDNFSRSLLSPGGGKYLSSVYGEFSNNATQSIAAANTPYVIALNTTDAANGVSLASNQMTVAQAGVYNCQFSFQFENTAVSITEVWVWLRRNGADVANTASVWSVTASHGGVNGYMIGAANFYVTMEANDYLELAVAANATGINIEAYAASTSPFTRPGIPSSVVTLSFVSAPLR